MIEWSVVKINSKDGSGTRITFEVVPKSEWENGSLVLRFRTRGGLEEEWGKPRSFVFSTSKTAEIVCVLRGMKESLNSGKGFMMCEVETGRKTTVKMFHRLCRNGYEFSAESASGKVSVFLDERQALVLVLSLERFIPIIAFGNPDCTPNPLGFEDGNGGEAW